ncbi:hypothetical protein J3169_004398 [Salmonella enterica]|nr:hypothetical protein [Salmonella enterica]
MSNLQKRLNAAANQQRQHAGANGYAVATNRHQRRKAEQQFRKNGLTLAAFLVLDDADAAQVVALIIGAAATANDRHVTTCEIVARLLRGEELTAEELRSQYTEDSARFTDVIRNKFYIPLKTHKGGGYSIVPDERARFLSPAERKQQRRACFDLITAQQQRKKARNACELERDNQRDDLPEWYHEQAQRPLPSVRRGVADFERG